MIMSWPPNSPDLNPIENCWKLLKDNVKATLEMDYNKFVNEIKKQWESIKYETIYNLIESMPIRIAKVIQNNGDYIIY